MLYNVFCFRSRVDFFERGVDVEKTPHVILEDVGIFSVCCSMRQGDVEATASVSQVILAAVSG